MPRSSRGGDGEHLAAGNHEVIRVAWVLDLGKSRVERGLEHRSWVVGAQLQPGAEPRLLVIWCSLGELDAQMPSPRKADHEHRLVDARKVDGSHRATQHRLKAPSQFPAPVRAREDMHVAAKSDHDVTGPSPPDPAAIRSTLLRVVVSSHKTRSRRPVMPRGHRSSMQPRPTSRPVREAWPDRHSIAHLTWRAMPG